MHMDGALISASAALGELGDLERLGDRHGPHVGRDLLEGLAGGLGALSVARLEASCTCRHRAGHAVSTLWVDEDATARKYSTVRC